MKIAISRVRNESKIIKNTLDHVSKYFDKIIIYDDCSTDNTVEICKKHPKVETVICNTKWAEIAKERSKYEGIGRQIPYLAALSYNPDWIYNFDADEYIQFENIEWDNPEKETYYFRLFDYYITENDKNDHYLTRKYIGPEYRDIIMLFRPNKNVKFKCRVPSNVNKPFNFGGYVKHYGKAISIEEFNETCEYYSTIHPDGQKQANKWKNRIGKAIHTKSDFNRDLITWDQIKSDKIVKLK